MQTGLPRLATIKELRNNGWTLTEIAKILNVTTATIYNRKDKESYKEKLILGAILEQGIRVRNSGVYYLKHIDQVKIGQTKNLKNRTMEIQLHCPEKLELIAWYENANESEHHHKWRHKRVRGEWFKFDPGMVSDDGSKISIGNQISVKYIKAALCGVSDMIENGWSIEGLSKALEIDASTLYRWKLHGETKMTKLALGSLLCEDPKDWD